MICRKCGAEIPDNALRCEHCGIKVNMFCPECNTLNTFGAQTCKHCGFELIKICPQCSSKNLFSASECRKCHYDFNKNMQISHDAPINDDLSIVRPFSSEEPAFAAFQAFEKNIELDNESSSQPTEEEKNKFFKVEVKPVEEEIYEYRYRNNTSEDIDKIISDAINVAPIEEVVDYSVKESLEQNYNDEFENSDEEQKESEDIPLTAEIKVEAVQKIVNIIKTSLTKHIIAVNGPDGSGKSAVLKQTNDNLSKQGFICLYGSCTPLLQITSFGFFQDALLRIMGFPPYTNNIEAFSKEFKKSDFAKNFNFLNGNELNAFLNIFYPSQKDDFENILDNKTKMFSILEKVIKSFLVNNNLVISVDNFELLDGASYDFISYMLNKGYFNNRLKMIISYKENKSIQSYFDLTSANENIFETIVIKKFNNNELIKAVSSSVGIRIDEVLNQEYLDRLIQKVNGNAIRLEQEIALLTDTGYISKKGKDIFLNEDKKPEIDPISFEELIKLRLNALKPAQKNVLFMAAVMGFRFSASILCIAVNNQINKTEQILTELLKGMYIVQVDNYTCEFKSLTLWKLIYQEAKADLLYKENAEHLFSAFRPLILSSNVQKLISCADAISKNEAFTIWQETSEIAAKLGDTNLYVISKKQCLKLLDEFDINNSDNIKALMYEEIGKLLCEKSPQEAISYLSNVLDADIKAGNILKIIDISGYFVKSCYLTGNYFGAAEAVDAVVNALETNKTDASNLDIALIKTRKLKALLNIGNSEQIINLINDDIIIELDKALNLKQSDNNYRNLIMNAWMNSKLTLAKAYCIQGNNHAENIIDEMNEFIKKYDFNQQYYDAHIKIIDALSKTMSGDILKSGEILTEISNLYARKVMDIDALANWNLVNIINRVLLGQNKDLKVDLFEFAAFANNINEYFMKNIIKLILGYILKKEGNTTKALEIFNDQITYFAKEKVAIGALLAWALIVKISMEMGDDDKALNTASKSLEIAQSSKINNNFFIIYFQIFLAQIYIRKNDFAAAKMYLEKSIMIAKQFNLRYQLIELYVEYAKYTEELMKFKHIYSSENLNITLDMYNKAVNLAKELHLGNMVEYTSRERSGFKTFCQLNAIEL